jgi:secretion/DNA translocation related TadE-like protein
MPTKTMPTETVLYDVKSESGAGSVLVVALIAVVAFAGLTLIGAAQALVRGQQVSAGADSAALAAADVLLGWVAGEPCVVAQQVAEAHSARLVECVSTGLTVQVRVEASIFGVTVSRSARAGIFSGEW